MTNLSLHFTAEKTFSVTPPASPEILGFVTYVFNAKEQPVGYCFKTPDGKSGKLSGSIADALRDHFGADVHFSIDTIL